MSFFESFYFPVLIFSVVCYWAIPSSKVKKFSLFFFSFFLFSITKFPFMLGLFLQTVFIYLINQKLKKNKKIAILSFALIIPLSILIVFKYLPPLLDWKGIILPIGISYFTFKHIHYCIEMYRDNTAEGDFLTYLSYIYFLPIFIAGPIERWNNYCSQIQNIQFKQQDLSTGMELILTGCIKKLVISDILLNSFLPENNTNSRKY